MVGGLWDCGFAGPGQHSAITMHRRATPAAVNEEQATYEAKVAPNTPPQTFIDLFCGCGGFTLGMLRAGFRCLAAVDVN